MGAEVRMHFVTPPPSRHRLDLQCGICRDATYIQWEPQPAGAPLKFTTGCAHAGVEAHRQTGHERWLAFTQPHHDHMKGN